MSEEFNLNLSIWIEEERGRLCVADQGAIDEMARDEERTFTKWAVEQYIARAVLENIMNEEAI